jgi:PAS domain S-box-containing protein
MLNKIWVHISNAGIQEGGSPSESKRFILMNQLIAVTFLFTIFYTLFFASQGYPKAVIAEMFFICAYLIIWIISKESFSRLAKFLFLSVLNIHIYIFCLLFGEDSQVYLIYTPIATATIMLYGSKQKKVIVFFLLVTVFLLIDLFTINFSSALLIKITGDSVHYFRLISNVITLLCEVIVIAGFVINSDETEKILGRNNILLEDQFKTIFNNSSDALFLVDNDSQLILKANDRAVELFEVEKECEFYSHLELDFRKEKPSSMELYQMRNRLLIKDIFEYEFLYRSKKEKEFWGAFAERLFEIRGKKFIIARITDISDKKKSQEFVKSSLHEKEVLLSEIHHRVKNNLAVISSLLGLQASYIEDENLKILLEESRNRIYTMALIHENLYQNETFARIKLGTYINDLVNNIKASYNAITTNINFSVITNDIVLGIKYAVPCGLILNELITNACKHAFKYRETGEIKIEFTQIDNKITMMVSDDGIGFNADDLLNKSNTLGLTLIIALTDQLDGILSTSAEKGITYYLTFEI